MSRLQILRSGLPLLLLACAAAAGYGAYLESPIFFDDVFFFYGRDFSQPQFTVDQVFMLRWLPYASIEWTVSLFGEELFWLRLGNLVLHLGNAILLLFFLQRLLRLNVAASEDSPGALSSTWAAFAGALWFLLHPVATFGVAYLVQRSILLATLFSLLTWWFFLAGLMTERRRWLFASGLTYLLAGMSKEHAILVPAVSLILLFLRGRIGRPTFRLIWPAVVTYLLVGCWLFYQANSSQFLAQAYEPYADDVLGELGISPETAYPLSVITQSFLYFRYLALWLFPLPSALSITMGSEFARSYLSWPQLIGPLLLVAYTGFAVWLLRQRGERGLLGFALLAPAVLFAVELTVVRVQEIFVLYRSYLWMPCFAVAITVFMRRMNVRLAIALMMIFAILLGSGAMIRLNMFADPVAMWREALEHTVASPTRNRFTLARAHQNLGQSYIEQGRYAEALPHLSKAIDLTPNESGRFNDRAVAYFKLGQIEESLADYAQAIKIHPYVPLYYFGRAEVYRDVGNIVAAKSDYALSCRLGQREACKALAGDDKPTSHPN